ncbi:DNA-directed RNA polymerase subunit beta [Trichinella spiralis]|uniref:DNA-directed RNA polymerase subunit beta n=1 Tax=Trichinella spiralis TaxID=6334 RepID=A0ABR3K8X1_TRISP
MVSIMLCKILPFRNPSFSALSYKNVRSLSSNRYENGKATNNNRHIILEVKRNKKTISLNNRTSAANFGINIDSILSTPFLATADNSDYENAENCSSYKFPSVTKILEESRSEDGQQILIKWKQAMMSK